MDCLTFLNYVFCCEENYEYIGVNLIFGLERINNSIEDSDINITKKQYLHRFNIIDGIEKKLDILDDIFTHFEQVEEYLLVDNVV
jgi:hypothetical protein